MRITSSLAVLVLSLASAQVVLAQANLPLYTNNLVNGFQDWSFSCTRNITNNTPVTNGTHSISVTMTSSGYGALALQFPDGFNSAPYTSLSFWINGGPSGGQHLKVAGTVVENTVVSSYTLPALTANTWQQFTIPLSTLGVANTNSCSGIWIQNTTSGSEPVFYVDDIQFNAAPAPALVHLDVNAASVVRTVDARQFGVNTATWDSYLGNSQTIPLLQEMGCLTLRWPGGSTSDAYNWATDPSGNATFRNVATNLGAQVFTTVNYGSGTAKEAAAWVLADNKTNGCVFQYWEIGNECYGSWENDTHAIQHDPYTYATNAVAYIQQMKAAYPAVPIKVGVVVVPGEGSSSNNANHFAINPVTGTTNYGWTPIVLSTMASQGVLPDFLIYHYYPEYTPTNWEPNSPDSDPLLLQIAGNPSPAGWNDWASAAASLRQQITDYIGPAGTNIELCVTENNSDSGAGFGRQLTSLVNALYLADSTCELMKTEFNSYLWWDLRNGPNSLGSFDPTIYGWRTYGDEGIIDGASSLYPTFYAGTLLQYFARPGDSVLNATSDYLLLSAYAVQRTNGALTLLVLNKDTTTNFNGQIALAGYVPWTNATIQSYGIPQDQAVEFSQSASLQDIATTNFPTAGTNFTYSFPPLSLTLFTFAPAPSVLSALSPQPGQVVLQVQGQSGVPYIIQSSPDLMTWTPVSTNTLAGSTLNITNLISPGSPQEFWRAVWLP
ncbi:MAG: alpha-L-arabinofuranosidase [Limisphaerales bacterium]